jgi:small ligand-binding sensory domain FIST
VERGLRAAAAFMAGWPAAIFPNQQTTQVYLNGDVFEDGGVAISVGGDVKLAGVISQGCTPIGETWTLTRVEKNLIHHIGNRPAYAVLAETFQKLPPDEQRKAQGNLLIGLVVNEYLEDFIAAIFSCATSSAATRIPACWPSARCRARGRPCNSSGATPPRRPRT